MANTNLRSRGTVLKSDYYNALLETTSQIAKNLSAENVVNSIKKAFIEVIRVSRIKIFLAEEIERVDVAILNRSQQIHLVGKNLVVPCSIEGRILAIIISGPKISGEPFCEEDIKYLTILAAQAAIALDHNRIYRQTVKARERLVLADKMAAFGKLAAGLVHEIISPLAIIKGISQAIDRNLEDREFINDLKEIIPKEIGRVVGLVEELMMHGQKPKEIMAMVNINEVILRTIKLFTKRCEAEKVKLLFSFDELPLIKANPNQLVQVFTNIFLNSLQSMPDGGDITVDSSRSGRKVLVEISDSGKGIPQQQLKDIFEPFFTTREDGVGLGLAITHKIVKEHGGEIEVTSEVGKGTKFVISLPFTP